jgi:hypothetical protein
MNPHMTLLPTQTIGEQSGDKSPHAKDEETFADDVNYGIADCRRRLRSQRSTLRAQHSPPKDEPGAPWPKPATAQLEEREEAVIT